MTRTEILANLEEIENVARMACEEAKVKKGWENLRVKDVYSVHSLSGKYRTEVVLWINPYFDDLVRKWFHNFFLDRGYTNPPEFRFEW